MDMSSNPFSNPGSFDTVNSIDSIGNEVFGLISSVTTILFVVLSLLMVVLFVKSIMDRKKVKNELTVNSLNSVKTTSIILLVLNVLSTGIIGIVLSIISLVCIGESKKMLPVNIEWAASKANTATIINIVITALTVIGLILVVGGALFAGLVNAVAIGI